MKTVLARRASAFRQNAVFSAFKHQNQDGPMFGFMRGSRQHTAYRRVYAGCCSFQQSEYGISSLPFLSYESVLLYLTAVDAELAPQPSDNLPRCCRLQRKYARNETLRTDALRFCASFGLLLAKIKIFRPLREFKELISVKLLEAKPKP